MTNPVIPNKTKSVISEVVELENNHLKITLLPKLGGKMVQLLDKDSGVNFLKQPEIDLSNLESPQDQEPFLPPYAFGFDECFPTIASGKYQFNGEQINLPDHGELWSSEWDCRQDGNDVTLWADGNKLRYQFKKRIRLNETSLRISYELQNKDDAVFDYIWSAHPLLEVEEGDQIMLPDEVERVILNGSTDEKIGSIGDELSWPFLQSGDTDFRNVQSRDSKFAVKIFTEKLKTGTCGIYRKNINKSLAFSFDTNKTPYLGVWLCYGGWPEASGSDEYTIALEPCNGRPDSLEHAMEWDENETIARGEKKNWELEISVLDGKYKSHLL